MIGPQRLFGNVRFCGARQSPMEIALTYMLCFVVKSVCAVGSEKARSVACIGGDLRSGKPCGMASEMTTTCESNPNSQSLNRGFWYCGARVGCKNGEWVGRFRWLTTRLARTLTNSSNPDLLGIGNAAAKQDCPCSLLHRTGHIASPVDSADYSQSAVYEVRSAVCTYFVVVRRAVLQRPWLSGPRRVA